jgi:acyl-ACP thioesterase
VNLKTGRLLRVPQEIAAGMNMSPKYEMEYRPRKITIPDGRKICLPEVAVQRNDIDYNQHVNNAHYIRMALEFLPSGVAVASLRVEYKQAARFGARLQPELVESENAIYIILREAGSICCIMEFARAAGNSQAAWYAW